MNIAAAASDIGWRTDLVLYAITNGVAALTIARSRLTAPLRRATIHAPLMLGELVSCGYCLSHWGGLLFAVVIGGSLLHIIVNAGVITGLAILWMGVANKFWFMQETEIEELRDLLREVAKLEQDQTE